MCNHNIYASMLGFDSRYIILWIKSELSSLRNGKFLLHIIVIKLLDIQNLSLGSILKSKEYLSFKFKILVTRALTPWLYRKYPALRLLRFHASPTLLSIS